MNPSSYFVRVQLPADLPPGAREAVSLLVPRLASRFSFQGLEDWSVDVKNSRVLGAESEFHDLRRAGRVDPEMRVYFASREHGDRFALFLRSTVADLRVSRARRLAARDWMKAWRRHYRTQLLREEGERLALVPAWKKAPKNATIAVRIHPGQAFGTGTHPTTQLCLRLFLRHGRASGTGAVSTIDFGAGTGVLALAAEKWARAAGRGFRGVAVESDPVALEQCRKNARLNRASGLRFVRKIPARAKGMLVFANVLAPVLLSERRALLGIVSPGGLLILSGLLAAESEAFLRRFRAPGFSLAEHAVEGDWAAIALRRR